VANTQSKEVNLTKRVLTSKGLRYCPVAISAYGRIKPDQVIVKANRNDTLKARTIWNGVRMAGGCVCRLGKMQPTPLRDGNEKKLNSMQQTTVSPSCPRMVTTATVQ